MTPVFPATCTINGTMGPPVQSVTATITNHSSTAVCLSAFLEARPLKPSTGTYALVNSSQQCSTGLIAVGGTWTYSLPIAFIRNNLTPGAGQVAAQADSTNWSAGWQYRLTAQVWTAANCGGTHVTAADVLSESTAVSVTGAIADINAAQTTYAATCNADQSCTIVSLGITNTGNAAGTVGYRVYNCSPATCTPTSAVTDIVWTTANVAAGATVVVPVTVTAPTNTIAYTYGVKVWGYNETEPTGFTLIIGPGFGGTIDPVLLGLGIVGAAGVVGILWYTKKKKMW